MKDTEKQAIADLLKAYCDLKGSQNKAAASLNAVSAATISQIFNGNWELITDEMWRTIPVCMTCSKMRRRTRWCWP